jgi:phosphoserine phosphatase RsbU/P
MKFLVVDDELINKQNDIGKIEPFEFETKQIQCTPGDRIILYTDGVTEAVNETDEMYEEDRLIEYLKMHQPGDIDKLVRGVVVHVLKFMGKTIQSDDSTLLTFEYRGPTGKNKDIL